MQGEHVSKNTVAKRGDMIIGRLNKGIWRSSGQLVVPVCLVQGCLLLESSVHFCCWPFIKGVDIWDRVRGRAMRLHKGLKIMSRFKELNLLSLSKRSGGLKV